MAVAAYGEPLAPVELDPPHLSAGHARLEVLTCGICYSDVKTARRARAPPRAVVHVHFGRKRVER